MTPHSLDVGRLPERVLASRTKLYRIHEAGYGALWFSQDEKCRFALCAPHAKGSLYVCEVPLACWAEAFGHHKPGMCVDERDIDVRRLSTITFEPDFKLADLTVREAGPANVSQAVIYANESDTQKSAAKMEEGGFEGVFWRSNRDLEGKLTSIALFGPAGAHNSWGDCTLDTRPISKSLARRAVNQLLYEIVPPPLASAGY